ncbi:hypothetical protein BGZ95_005923 [Linnemannia exigua]|uniref:Uncharacterized protein n=1 Tax=Linnemannia exigua TaxID=604196 RepID=A0AAD4D3H0_9FUNG|nr:hypothetical protein BGZ95_005923 [Linnemannia exigua]
MTHHNDLFHHVPRRIDNTNDPSPLPDIVISYDVIPALDLPAIQNQLNTVVAQMNALNIAIAQDDVDDDVDDDGEDGDGEDDGDNDDDDNDDGDPDDGDNDVADKTEQGDPAAEVENREDSVVVELDEGSENDAQESDIVVEVNVIKEAEEPEQDLRQTI